jgi:peptide deformylase
MRSFLGPYDAKLNRYSRELSGEELSSIEIQSILSDMKKLAYGERNAGNPNYPSLSGLAAPQIGEFIRLILVDLKADGKKVNLKPDLKFFINPKIIETSDSESPMREGCFSTGRICGAVIRPDWVRVSALDENGKQTEYRTPNIFQSHVIQHEIDHLNGIRFPSRIRNSNKFHYVEIEEFQDYRDNWGTWDKLCPYEDWLKMYEGTK